MMDAEALARVAVEGCDHIPMRRSVDGLTAWKIGAACHECIAAAIREGQRAVLDVPHDESGRLLYEIRGDLQRFPWERQYLVQQDAWGREAQQFLAALRTRAGL